MFEYTQVHASRTNDKFSTPYILVDLNWNDFGYYTLFELYKVIHNGINKKIAVLNCVDSDNPTRTGNSVLKNPTTIIHDIDSAIKMLLFMPYQERIQAINSLNIVFDLNLIKNNIHKSILRDNNFLSFQMIQQEIQNIILLPFDINNILPQITNILSNNQTDL